MSIDLYYLPMSSPCRAVLLTAEAIEIELNYKVLDITVGENQTPEYEQMNPQKTIPFLIDDDYKLSESRAIMCYLVDQYGDNSTLYPPDPYLRAVIHHRLHFDASTLYKYVMAYYYPVAFRGETEYNEANYEKLKDAVHVLDTLLAGNDYTAGSNLTIADLALIATISTAEALGFDLEEYPNIAAWAERVKSSAPGYDTANAEGVEILKKFITSTSSE